MNSPNSITKSEHQGKKQPYLRAISNRDYMLSHIKEAYNKELYVTRYKKLKQK